MAPDAVDSLGGSPAIPAVVPEPRGRPEPSAPPVRGNQPPADLGAVAGRGSSASAPGGGSAPSAPPPGGLRSTYARWMVDPQSHGIVVQVFDAATGEVLESVPPEDFTNRAKRMYGSDLGTLLDSRT